MHSHFLSALILFIDINYKSFAPLRGIVNASSLYVQIFSRNIVENVSFTFSSFKQIKQLLLENKKLREEILKIETKDFIEKKDNEEKIQIINFKEIQSSTFKSDDINIYKIASIDLKNYYCCSSHKIFLHNQNKITIENNLPVFAGKSFVGQTKNTHMSFIEVILYQILSMYFQLNLIFFIVMQEERNADANLLQNK